MDPSATATTVADLVRRKLDQARHQLIERNLRNKLVNCALTSKRSHQVRIVDELPDEAFKTLLAQKRDMTFAPGRGVASEDEDQTELAEQVRGLREQVDALSAGMKEAYGRAPDTPEVAAPPS